MYRHYIRHQTSDIRPSDHQTIRPFLFCEGAGPPDYMNHEPILVRAGNIYFVFGIQKEIAC